MCKWFSITRGTDVMSEHQREIFTLCGLHWHLALCLEQIYLLIVLLQRYRGLKSFGIFPVLHERRIMPGLSLFPVTCTGMEAQQQISGEAHNQVPLLRKLLGFSSPVTFCTMTFHKDNQLRIGKKP